MFILFFFSRGWRRSSQSHWASLLVQAFKVRKLTDSHTMLNCENKKKYKILEKWKFYFFQLLNMAPPGIRPRPRLSVLTVYFQGTGHMRKLVDTLVSCTSTLHTSVINFYFFFFFTRKKKKNFFLSQLRRLFINLFIYFLQYLVMRKVSFRMQCLTWSTMKDFGGVVQRKWAAR